MIDDPIISMYEGMLFCIFGYIKVKTKDAHQLFILTHNFMLFRQVKKLVLICQEQKKYSSLYRTKCTLKSGKRYSGIITLDKVLKYYESEYHCLLYLIYKVSTNNSNGLGIGEHYPCPMLLGVFGGTSGFQKSH